ncbi:MAG: transposase [Balneolaceae bacterium]
MQGIKQRTPKLFYQFALGVLVSARWFLGYDIDETLPVHSTLSRTGNLFGVELFEEVFCLVLGLCVDAGLVEGKRQVEWTPNIGHFK